MLVIHAPVFTKIFSIYMLRKPFHSTETNLVVKCRNVRILLCKIIQSTRYPFNIWDLWNREITLIIFTIWRHSKSSFSFEITLHTFRQSHLSY